jgi:methyl-accepting chemotaxis protein
LNTVDGITTIRDTIRETEKRIKRLGERSQEISGVVNLINSIAERTHILALNASMHAASAGEAGRGFAVVADEVQRLAENARNATSEIASLVNNIQVETNDTVTTMNEAISKVVEGTKLAERAGSEMKDTQATTAELVGMVQQIAKQSRLQAKTSNELRTRAQGIQKSSRDANAKLREQTTYTENLVVYSKRLLDAVHVFTLPEVERSAPGAKTGSVGDTLRIFPENKAAAVNA